MIESANEKLNLLNLYMDLGNFNIEAQKFQALSEALQTNPDPPLKLSLPLQNFQSSLDSYSSEIQSLAKTLQSLQESNSTLQSSLNQAKTLKDKKHATFQSIIKETTHQKASKEKELHDINKKLQQIAKDLERITKENNDKDKEITSLTSKLDILNPPDLETVGLTSEWQYLEGKAIEYETISPKYVDDYEEAGESIDDYQKYQTRKPENIEYILGIPQVDNPIYKKNHENYQEKLEESEKSSESDRKGWGAEDFDEDFNNDMEEIVVEEEQKILEYEEKPEDERNVDFDMRDMEKPSVVVDFVSESYDMQGGDTRVLAGFFIDKVDVVEEVKEVMEKEEKTIENEVKVFEEEEEEERSEDKEENVEVPCEWPFEEQDFEIQESFGKEGEFCTDGLGIVEKDIDRFIEGGRRDLDVEVKDFVSWEVRFGDEGLDKREQIGFSGEGNIEDEKAEEFENEENIGKKSKYEEKSEEENFESEAKVENDEKIVKEEQNERIVNEEKTEQVVLEERTGQIWNKEKTEQVQKVEHIENIEKEEKTLKIENNERTLKVDMEKIVEKKKTNENEVTTEAKIENEVTIEVKIENDDKTLKVEIEQIVENKKTNEMEGDIKDHSQSEKTVEEIKKVEAKEIPYKVEPPPPKKFFTKYQPKALPKKLQVKKTTDDAFFQELL